MKLLLLLSSALVLAGLPAIAGASTVSNFNATLTTANTTELGRNSRSGTPQTWQGAETYTGVINATTAYFYATYTFAASNFVGAQYIEISDLDSNSLGNSDFLVAYSGSYNPANPGLNWLGDEGSSGNYFGTDARYFDVILPVGQSLVLLFNTTAAAGLNDPHNIQVDAYTDTNYTDIPTPEPSTFITLGTGLIGVAGAWRRRFKASH